MIDTKTVHKIPGSKWEKVGYNRFYLDLPKIWENINKERPSNNFGRQLTAMKIWIDLDTRKVFMSIPAVTPAAKYFAENLAADTAALLAGEDTENFYAEDLLTESE